MIIEDKDFKGAILDVGCGPAILPIVAKLKNPELDISAMDGSSLNIVFAHELAKNAKVEINLGVVLVGQPLPKKFDTIVLNHIVEHMENLNFLFNWVDEQLTENGTMFIAIPYHKAHYSPNHVHFFSEKKEEGYFDIVQYLKDRKYKVEYEVFDEEEKDKRHPHKSKGQLDMFIKVKK